MANTEHPSPLRALRVTETASPERSRKTNRTLLLQALIQHGPLSRADLARQSSLSKPLVSDLVGELLDKGVIEQIGTRRRTSAGKPATMLAVRDDSFQIIALDLSDEKRFTGVVTNLRGKVLHRAEGAVAGRAGEAALDLVADLLGRLIQLSTAPLLGVGIGTPGIVESKRVVRLASSLRWENVDLAAGVRGDYEGAIHVANDANAAVLGMYAYRGAERSSLLLVTLEHGIGAGLIIGGSLVEGPQFAAGEIGHIVVDDDGDRCSCGLRGCLDLAASAPNLRLRLERDPSDRDRILSDAALALGRALTPMIALTGVKDVVIAGPVDLVSDHFLRAVEETIVQRSIPAVNAGLRVVSAPGGEDLVLLGAAAMVLSAELGVT